MVPESAPRPSMLGRRFGVGLAQMSELTLQDANACRFSANNAQSLFDTIP